MEVLVYEKTIFLKSGEGFCKDFRWWESV